MPPPARDRASSEIIETIFPIELQRVLSGDFCLAAAVWRCSVGIVVGGIKGDLNRVPRLLDAHLKHRLTN
jgi:hypothetical protein